jgi:hypothetical protein
MRATFAAGKSFGFVKAERRQFAKRCRDSGRDISRKTTHIIFYDGEAMPSGDGHDRLHFAANACVVHEKNRLRPFSDPFLESLFIDVQRIRSYYLWKDNFAVGNPRPDQVSAYSPGVEKLRLG